MQISDYILHIHACRRFSVQTMKYYFDIFVTL